MLVLSRRVGESIRIGNAVLTIQKIRHNQISVSVDAPRDVRVMRTELEPKPPHPQQPVAA